MKLNKKLNLVVPVEREGGTVFIHAAPIDRTVFERYFLVISKTFSAIHGEGLGITAGPRIAALMLRRMASELGELESVESGLLTEIRRLSNVTALGPQGWTTFPLEEAIQKDYLDEDDVSEVENALAFFIVASAMHKRDVLPEMLNGAAKLWGAQTTYLNCMEYAASLETSTETDNSGEKVKPSLIPS